MELGFNVAKRKIGRSTYRDDEHLHHPPFDCHLRPTAFRRTLLCTVLIKLFDAYYHATERLRPDLRFGGSEVASGGGPSTIYEYGGSEEA